MVIVLSLLAALFFGTGDFVGALATKRTTVSWVIAGSHAVGLVGVVIAAVVLAEEFRWRDLGLGALAGAFGGIGIALLYRRLAEGPMGVVAPLTAVSSAVVPAAWGVLDGDSLTVVSWVGVVLAITATGLVSVPQGSSTTRISAQPVTPQVVIESLLAGTGFGLFFIVLDATASESAPWPVVGARLFTVSAAVGLLAWQRRSATRRATASPVPSARTWQFIIGAGVFDTLSNVLFLYATNDGALTLVAVLSSLYPIATVLLARIFLSERMSRLQFVGLVCALTATACISAG